MHDYKIVIVSLLFVSAFIFFSSRSCLILYLYSKKVKLIFAYTGFPGYIERKYRQLDPNLKSFFGDILLKVEIVSFFIMFAMAILTIFFLIAGK
jgi:hypothetical protein